MYHTTGFTHAEIAELASLVENLPKETSETTWPPVLGLFNSVAIALTYLRSNRVQAELAETFGVS